NIYKAIEAKDQNNRTSLMMGPWFHGGWVRSDGSRLGNVRFGGTPSAYYDEHIRQFFRYYLKGEGELHLPEVSVFETGSNQWRSYTEWPPRSSQRKKIFLAPGARLSFTVPKEKNGSDKYSSDPNRPVPYISEISNSRGREYMTDDQRFAWQRPDVLSYEMAVDSSITISGPVTVDLYASTTGSDADFIVKVIDVFPDSTKDEVIDGKVVKLGGYQMLVRGDVMRGRYRNSYSLPEAMKPNKVEKIRFTLPDINHSFQKGHRLMIQVQSSWFPLVDRNPQTFVNIYKAKKSDFRKAVHTIYRSAQYPSAIEVGIIAE
ncbi:MAG: CocE/NonD family hydrolase, partial [Bacteroidota bacterium]